MPFSNTHNQIKSPLHKTQDTLWPSFTPHHTKLWADHFFQLLDGDSQEAAQQWSQLYTNDGEFEAFGQTFKGPDAIKMHLLRFWARFPGLMHTPKFIYISRGTHSGSTMDIIAVTAYAVKFTNGRCVSGESIALLNVVQQGDRLAIRSNRLYLDPSPLMQALDAQCLEDTLTETTGTHHENVMRGSSSNAG